MSESEYNLSELASMNLEKRERILRKYLAFHNFLECEIIEFLAPLLLELPEAKFNRRLNRLLRTIAEQLLKNTTYDKSCSV
jgi:hypothetical protein